MRGRKPKPTSLHALHGTFRPKTHAKRTGEPQAQGDLHAPPAWLTETQKEIWRLAIEHAPAGVLKQIDAGLLSIWCVAADNHRIATQQQTLLDAGSTLPLLTKGRDGTPVPSPYLRIASRCADTMLRAAAELGFTPAARPRLVGVGVAPTLPDPASPWAKLRLLQGGRVEQGGST